jgi:hypothetical protein
VKSAKRTQFSFETAVPYANDVFSKEQRYCSVVAAKAAPEGLGWREDRRGIASTGI